MVGKKYDPDQDASDAGRGDTEMSALQLTTEHREAIIRGVIRQATPRWWKWPFNWFNICPLDRVAEVFNIDMLHRNSAYLLLNSYHCVGQWSIPREIRQRIPDLIREALSSKTRMFCEIEEIGDVQQTLEHPQTYLPAKRTRLPWEWPQ